MLIFYIWYPESSILHQKLQVFDTFQTTNTTNTSTPPTPPTHFTLTMATIKFELGCIKYTCGCRIDWMTTEDAAVHTGTDNQPYEVEASIVCTNYPCGRDYPRCPEGYRDEAEDTDEDNDNDNGEIMEIMDEDGDDEEGEIDMGTIAEGWTRRGMDADGYDEAADENEVDVVMSEYTDDDETEDDEEGEIGMGTVAEGWRMSRMGTGEWWEVAVRMRRTG